VCVVTTVHTPGDARIACKQIPSLVGAGYRVTYLARGPRPAGLPDEAIYRPLPPIRSRGRRWLNLPAVAREALRVDADLYHCHDPELLALSPWLRRRGKVVFDVHENVPAQLVAKPWLPGWAVVPVRAGYGQAEKALVRSVDGLVLAEDSYAGRYDPGAVVVRNYPLRPSDPPPPHQEDRGAFRLFYAGGVSALRGIWTMLEAVARLNQGGISTTLTVAGDLVPASLGEEVATWVYGQGLQERVQLSGRVSYAQVLRELGSADVGLALLQPTPNYVDSLPTKMFDYMSRAVPVMVSDFPHWRAIVEEAGCGRAVDPLDVGAVVEGLHGLAGDPAERLAMGRRGWQAVRERYCWETEAEVLLGLYRRLLE
jgi:glycosyltransferase involved in cell wall biosynthesis